jgi:hypothetical protein
MSDKLDGRVLVRLLGDPIVDANTLSSESAGWRDETSV